MAANLPLHTDVKNVPLVVDIDGTFLKTDLLAESFRLLLLKNPAQAFMALPLIKNRAAFKKHVAQAVTLDMANLPVNPEVVSLIKEAKNAGRKVYLASAADQKLVEALAQHAGLFDGVFASDGITNLRGEIKAQVLCATFGEGGFDYVGDSTVDFPVWQKARAVIFAGASAYVARKTLERFPKARIVGKQAGLKEYASAMRVRQWPKNLLIFVPTIAAHMITFAHLLPAVIAFFSFSFCASSVYLLNDWFDLDDDRRHPTKRHRMLASGNLPLPKGTESIFTLLLLSLILASFLPKAFLMSLVAYYALTFAYSLWLKHQTMLDVITLACLYGIRILSGGALGTALTEWLVVFSIFLFLSLAMIKRCTELINCAAEDRGNPAGRSYVVGDIIAVFAMATASGYVAVLVLALYIQNPDVNRLYAHPQYLWGACLVLIYWISRVLLLTSRGEMHEDPVIFATSDRVSLLCGGALALLAWVSI